MENITYLTSGICEDCAHLDEDDFTKLGLPSGTFDGGFYPLTLDEDRFIADDPIILPEGPMVLLGYSVLHGDAKVTKYIAPHIEVDFGWDTNAGEEPARSEAEATTLAAAYLERCRKIAARVGGDVFEEKYDNRNVVALAIPVAFLIEKFAAVPFDGKFVAYKTWLEEQLTAA